MGTRIRYDHLRLTPALVDLNTGQRKLALALAQDQLRETRGHGLAGALVLAAWMGLCWLALVLWS